MKLDLVGEVWESFYVEGRKLGFVHRKTAVSPTPDVLTTTMTLMYGTARFHHAFSFYNEAGYRPHSYLFDSNDGAPVHVRFVDDEIVCQVDEQIFRETMPVNTRPSYGYYPLVVTLPFTVGARVAFTRLDDASCTVQGTGEFVAVGWEDVAVAGERVRLWLVQEMLNGRLANRYWLDEERRIRKSNWRGATSYWVPTQEEALASLPQPLLDDALNMLSKKESADWMDDIVTWLANN